MPPTVRIESNNASKAVPLMVVARQPKQVLSWQLPLIVDDEMESIPFNTTSRILCYDIIRNLGKIYQIIMNIKTLHHYRLKLVLRLNNIFYRKADIKFCHI